MNLDKSTQLHREGLHTSGIATFAQTCANALYEKHRLPSDISHVVHYTTLETLMSILGVEASRQAHQLVSGASSGSVDDRRDNRYLRLYDTNYSNDPNEGDFFVSVADRQHKILSNYRSVWKLLEERSAVPAYVTSFACVSSLDEVDDLVFWRTYGKEGRGCALAFPVSCFWEETSLYRVRYGESAVAECLDSLGELLDEYGKVEGSPSIQGTRRTSDLPKPIQNVLSPLVYLCKADAYEYEKEARMVVPFSDLKNGLYVQSSSRGKQVTWRHFAEVPSLAIGRLFVSNAFVVLGPTVEYAANVQFVLEQILLSLGCYGPKVVRSRIAYRD